MKNSIFLNMGSSSRFSRLLVLSVAVVTSCFIFGLAVTASAATLTRELQVGSVGQDVSDLQTFLAKDSTIYPQGLVTGYFGLLTKAAVTNFQARNGIATVGRVGPITRAAINAQMSGSVTNASPSINSVNTTVSTNTASLSWNTNENSSSVLYYGTSPLSMIEASPTTGVTIGGSSVLVNSNMQSSHATTLTNLTSNTIYHYVIYVRDVDGNESVSWPSTFRTN